MTHSLIRQLWTTARPAFLLSFIVFAIPLLCTMQTSGAAEKTDTAPLKTARQLKERLTKLSSLHFQFTQRTEGQMSGRVRTAQGEAYFIKSGEEAKMRWDYLKPDRQVIISDGSELTMYFANLNQMIVAPADSLQQDVTYTFFTGTRSIEEDFIVRRGEKSPGTNTTPGQAITSKETQRIKLLPKSSESQVKSIRLWIVDTSTIKRIEIIDKFDTVTTLDIDNIEENSLTSGRSAVDEDFFNFTPPKNTEIIRQ
ncbi:MAG: outer membrane lipoprotein carrier protein LolA [Desulfopila sp.]